MRSHSRDPQVTGDKDNLDVYLQYLYKE